MLQRFSPLLAIFVAACSQSGSSPGVQTSIDVATPGLVAPTEPHAPPQLPDDVNPPAPTPPGWVRTRPDTNFRHHGGRSLLDSATETERESPVVDEVDYAGLPPEVVSLLAASPAVRYRARLIDGYPGLYEFVLVNTGSGWQEKFLLQVPRGAPPGPRPLVVVFHKFGSSHGDLISSGFIPEARARGWYAICPLGARQKNFGNFESQINVRASLELVRSLFPIDAERIYGVGFSMGGGSAANYAARHLDPKGVMFAAVVDHTGGVSLAHTYWNEPDDTDTDDDQPLAGNNLEVPDILEDLFGGTPLARAFEYQRCSTIDLDAFTGQIGADTDFARNLGHVPTLIWMAVNDPTAYLQTQTLALDAHVQGQNAANTLHIAPGSIHAWTTLDPTFVCNWLAQFTLTLPRAGRMLADEDGQWLSFFVEQSASGSFTPFTWSVDAANKLISVTATQNLQRLRIHSAAMGVAVTGALTIDVSTADGTGDVVQLLYVPSAPLSVTRDGVPASGVHDAVARTFAIQETDPALHRWVVTFP